MIWYWVYCIIWWIVVALIWTIRCICNIIWRCIKFVFCCCIQNSKSNYSISSRRKGIPRYIRRELWRVYFQDSDIGKCYCCAVVICRTTHRGWHAAHVVSVYHGGTDDLDNLRPTCPRCNLSMGVTYLYEYIETNKLQGLGMSNLLIRKMQQMKLENNQRTHERECKL